MQRYGVRRLIVLSASGTQPGRDPNLPSDLRPRRQAGAPRPAYDDLRRMETSVRQSELDWTIVRVSGGLTDGPARGVYRVEPGYSLPGGRRIARADVAEYLLDQLTLRGRDRPRRGDRLLSRPAAAGRATSDRPRPSS